MKACKTVEEYILNVQNGKEILIVLHKILQATPLEESIKWGIPVYTMKGKNIVGMSATKSYAGLWFFQGALLRDESKVLINAQEDKTKAQRQWRFSSIEEIDESLVLKYLEEAIENHRQNREIKPDRTKPLLIPRELKEEFRNNSELQTRFNAFTKGKQREFAEYISEGKRAETRVSRIQKIIPLIKQNIGLNDKYRK